MINTLKTLLTHYCVKNEHMKLRFHHWPTNVVLLTNILILILIFVNTCCISNNITYTSMTILCIPDFKYDIIAASNS